jgi:NADPH:quinone reductase-like Zn-dependent oxidoreductase
LRIYGFAEYGPAGVEGWFDVPEPRPGPGQVLVDLRAAGVNPADVKVRSGQRAGRVEVAFPMAMGREACGVVVDPGPSGRFAPGDLVFGSSASGHGVLAERVLLDEEGVAAVPDGVTGAQAACIPVAVGTASDALVVLSPSRGQVLLVLGAGGGVGTSAVQVGRHLGLRVLGVASAGKRELVESLGATHITSGPGWEEHVRRVAPDGADVLLDCVGGSSLTLAASLVGEPRATRSVADPAGARALGGDGVTRRRSAEVFAEVADLVARAEVVPVIGATYAFDDAAKAVARVETGHASGRTVVVR